MSEKERQWLPLKITLEAWRVFWSRPEEPHRACSPSQLAPRPLGVLLDSGTELVVASESPSSILLGFSQPGLLFKNTHSHFHSSLREMLMSSCYFKPSLSHSSLLCGRMFHLLFMIMFLQQVFIFTPPGFCWQASFSRFDGADFIMQLSQRSALHFYPRRIPKQPFKVSYALIKNSSAFQK